MNVTDAYSGREQTKAKHFILRRYLQALAFKVLTFSDITYVDGFSGPWETKTENFSDSSFMIAISVLKDAQKQIIDRTGKTFRQIEYDALRKHAKNRAAAMEKRREERLNVADLFASYQAEIKEATIDEIVLDQKSLAEIRLIQMLSQRGPLRFSRVVSGLLEPFMLRETNIKDICVSLAKSNKIENTWGRGNRKPSDDDMIRLKVV